MTVSFSASGVKHRTPVDTISLGESATSKVIGRLERLLVQIVALEFLVIAGTSYLASAIYYETFLSTWPPIEQYVPAALSIALLVLFTALGFKHYLGVQAQSRDRFMWSGIGAVALAFSLFLSLLFVFKIADWYSRGTFFFQFIGAATAILITRGTIHAHIRRAIASGAVEARRAVVIGDPNDNREILNNLRQSGIRSVGRLPFLIFMATLFLARERFRTTFGNSWTGAARSSLMTSSSWPRHATCLGSRAQPTLCRSFPSRSISFR